MLFGLGYVPQINYPNRITSFSATPIDHNYTNNVVQKTTSYIIVEDISDYFLEATLLNNIKNKNISTNNFIRDNKNFTEQDFLIDFQEHFNMFDENYNTIDDQFQNFIVIFCKVLD